MGNKSVTLLNGVILMPQSEMKVKTDEKDWSYAQISPGIVIYQTYDEDFTYFVIKNLSDEQQEVELILHWTDARGEFGKMLLRTAYEKFINESKGEQQ